jgi:hypothetical protein
MGGHAYRVSAIPRGGHSLIGFLRRCPAKIGSVNDAGVRFLDGPRRKRRPALLATLVQWTLEHGPGSVLPEILEPIRRHFGVANRVHDISMAHVVLEGSGVMPIVGELVTSGVPEHVRVDRE